MDKIVAFPDLTELIKKLKGKQIVLVGGCFDILHLGHVRFLKAAKKYGMVIVALESDANVVRRKGVNRPIHKQAQRAEVLAHLESVDYVILLPSFSTTEEYTQLTKTVSPDFVVVTEGDPLLDSKRKQLKKTGAKIVVIPKINTPSTTQLAKLLKIE